MLDAPSVVLDLARARARDGRDRGPVVVGIAGGVAVGKTTLAAGVQAAGRVGAATRVEVVSTDGVLHPNAALAERELLMRKGFPESYDVDALRAFVDGLRAGALSLRVPLYSHDTYDVVPDAAQEVRAAEVVVIEGVNALSALAGALDLGVYLDAEEAQLEAWFLERFHRLRRAAVDDAGSFYRMFAEMSLAEADSVARSVWREVNLVNLREHIAPSRVHAHCTVVKGPGHVVTAIDLRDDGLDSSVGS